jgi:energy-coupling factor transport system ATP-binding protein
MNGLLTPTSGEVFLDGKNVFESKKTLAEARRKVGFVFQYPEYQLFADTCLADVAFGPMNMGLAKDEAERRAIFAMEELGLDPEKLAEKSPFELSGGEKRKVAIAGVMAMEPTVLVLDEPTAFLDPKSHRGFMELILKLNREKNVTIILVTHNMDDACEYADKILLLKDGELVASGEPKEIFSDEKLLAKTKLRLPKAAAYARKHGAMGAIKYAELIEALRAKKGKENAKKNAE